MAASVVEALEEHTGPSISDELRRVVSDAFVFVRSAEINKAIATVTIEDLMADQIARNGESDASNANQYDPYTFDPTKKKPAGVVATGRVNFAGGSDTTRPTKIQRILAIKNTLSAAIDKVKKTPVIEVASPEEYADEE